jgi:exopolyphosphatase/guanosine-5'-triphosphate,3'-diphosphate pyrophosphatase
MAVTSFAAIDIGSYNVSMEIFEITKKNGLRSLNRVRKRLELGKDTFNLKKISTDKLHDLTAILLEFKKTMAEYRVTDYRACAKSALREARNCVLVQEQVFQSTGIRIEVLSNSEQRYLGYKSIASRGPEFQKIIEKGCAIVDVGGGSIQISLFDKDALVTTQNILLGSLRIRERLSSMENEARHYDELVSQYIDKDILNFKRMYLKDRRIENIILVGDYFTNLIFRNKNDADKVESKEEFMQWYRQIVSRSENDLTREMGIGPDIASVVIPTAILYRRLIEELGASSVWLPGIQLTDGIAYDYGDRKKIIQTPHDFDRDILMAAKNMAKRFAGNKPHTEAILGYADAVFDAVRKGNGLGSRDKLLLRVAACLHDVGKYISLVNVADCSYSIIMASEIIGLSHREREIIANVVKFNTKPFIYYNESPETRHMDRGDYMLVAKLSAILRLANGLDQSYRQKIAEIAVTRKDPELTVTVDPKEDFALEKGIFEENKAFFEEVFGLKAELKLKKKKG